MRNRLNPWVVVLTAALTFGSLMAFVGPRSFGHHWGRYGYYDHGHHHRYNYDDWKDRRDDRRADQAPMRPDSATDQ